MATSNNNYSIYAIPAYFILAMLPHAYASNLIKRGTNGRFDNANPRGTSFNELYKKSLDKPTLARVERCKGAHANALETMPLFVAAVVCANMAGLGMGVVNAICGVFLGLRVAYTFLYIGIENPKLSLIRSSVWMASVGCCMTLLIKAGNVLVDGKRIML